MAREGFVPVPVVRAERAVELECGLEFAHGKIALAIADVERACEAGKPELAITLRLSLVKAKLENVLREIETAQAAIGVVPRNDNDTDDEIIEA